MIGKNIRRIRKQQGLTLSELAERAGIAKSYLSNIERNVNQNPSIQVLERLAAVLDVDIQVLLGIEPPKELQPDDEWMVFIKELQDSGIDKGELGEYRSIIQFIKWQQEKEKKAKSDEEGKIPNGN